MSVSKYLRDSKRRAEDGGGDRHTKRHRATGGTESETCPNTHEVAQSIFVREYNPWSRALGSNSLERSTETLSLTDVIDTRQDIQVFSLERTTHRQSFSVFPSYNQGFHSTSEYHVPEIVQSPIEEEYAESHFEAMDCNPPEAGSWRRPQGRPAGTCRPREIFGKLFDCSSPPPLRVLTRKDSAEHRAFLRQYYPELSPAYSATSFGPLTPAQSSNFIEPIPTAPARAFSYESIYSDVMDVGLSNILEEGPEAESEDSTNLGIHRSSSPEPMAPHQLQDAPESTISSVIVSALPPGPHTGTRRALVIALQYAGQVWNDWERSSMKLKGPYADVDDIRRLLHEHHYREEDITVMKDDAYTSSYYQPTYENLRREICKLVDDAQPGDRFFLYFAGHGKQVPDTDGDEKDGYDEGIIPSDWSTAYYYSNEGIIIDDFLKIACVDRLPQGSQLTAVFDCCHAGTILDLPYEYASKNGPFPRRGKSFDKAARRVMQYGERDIVVINAPGEKKAGAKDIFNTKKSPHDQSRIRPTNIGGRALLFSACADSQNAYAREQGLLTKAFTEGIRSLCRDQARHGFEDSLNPNVKHLYSWIVAYVHDSLHGHDRVQDPMFSTSYRIKSCELNRQIVI